MTHSRSLFLHYYFMVQQRIDDKDGTWWQYGTWWQDHMMMTDGLAGGIIPSWEGVLNYETMVKLHIGKPILCR